MRGEAVPDAHGLPDGVARDALVGVVPQKLAKLQAEQPALGEHPAALLLDVAEVAREGGIRNDERLAEKRADLRPADVKRVAKARKVGQAHVIFIRGERVAEPRAVAVEENAPFVADRAKPGQLGERIEPARLRRQRNVGKAGLDRVLVVGVGPVRGADGVEVGRVQLAVRRNDGQHLVPRGLDGAGLVHGDVPGVGADRALMRPERAGEHRQVRLRPADEKMHLRVRRGAQFPHPRARGVRDSFDAVAARLDEIVLLQRPQDLGDGALGVVGFKSDHEGGLLW